MPWKENCTLEERMTLMCDYLDGAVTMAELCRRCGISRKTGYKWLERNRVEGLFGLQARSRAPHGRPRAMIVAVPRLLRRRVPLQTSPLGICAGRTPRTIRSGGNLNNPKALMPPLGLGPPACSFAVDAHGCIMVLPFRGDRKQVCAR